MEPIVHDAMTGRSEPLERRKPAVQIVTRRVYVVQGHEYPTEEAARRAAAFDWTLNVKNDLANAMVTDGAPPKMSDAGSIAAWLVENRAVIRPLFDEADAIEASILVMPLKEGADPIPNV